MDRRALAWTGALILAAALGAWLLPGSTGRETASTLPARTAPEPTAPAPALATAPAPAPGAGDAAAPSARGAVPAGTVTVVSGQVVDATQAPAAGARVVALGTAGALAEAACGEDGAFSLRLAPAALEAATTGALHARGADGSVGWCALPAQAAATARAPGEADRRQVGTIVLGPAHAFDAQVVSSCGAAPPATLWLTPEWTEQVPWTTTPTDARGRARFEGVPGGAWLLVAAAPGCGRAWTLVRLPRASGEPVVIELPEAHALTVRVVDAQDESPIAGATVEVLERRRMAGYGTRGPLVSIPWTHTTNAAGLVVLDGLGGTEQLLLRAVAEGYPQGSEHQRRQGSGPGEARVEPGQGEVVIRLARPLTVRWPLEDRGHGIPPDGTEVVLVPWTNSGRNTVPPRGRIEDGDLVVPGWSTDGASGYAIQPDTLIARLQAAAGAATGHPTAFYPLRRIEARVRLPGGEPAVGWSLLVRDQGNNAVQPPVPTDAGGRAVMSDLYGGPMSLVQVSVASGADARGGFELPLGSVDLARQDGDFDVEVPAERTLKVRLTVLGGPAPADLVAQPLLDHYPAGQAERDPATGRFTVHWRPSGRRGAVTVSAAAEGYLATPVEVGLEGAEDPIGVTVDLRPAGALEVLVKEPADRRCRIGLERWDDAAAAWGPPAGGSGPSLGPGRRPDAGGSATFDRLEPGRYRAVETTSGLTSDPVEVAAAGPLARVVLDASKAGWVRGRVEVPEGEEVAGLTVGPEGARPDPRLPRLPGTVSLPGTAVNPKDGTFWVRVPGTRPVTLRIYHATMRPHPTRGRVTVTEPTDGVVLAAVAGPVATLRFATTARVTFNPGSPRSLAVRLYDGAVSGPGLLLSGTLDGAHRTVRFGGYEPGTWTVWVDAPGAAPVVLPGVVLGTGDADLGEVALADGGTFRLDVLVKEGQSPPRFAVWVQAIDEPSYTRSTDAAGASIRVRGLGPGRFRVGATPYGGGVKGLVNEEVESDGATEIVRTIDAR